MMKKSILSLLLLGWVFVVPAAADSTVVDAAAVKAQADLDAALRELAGLRESIAAEKIPLTRDLRAHETRLLDVRTEFEDATRGLDKLNLELANLAAESKGLKEQHAYLTNLFGEYIRNLESRVHVTELQRYREPLDAAARAIESTEATPAEIYAAQTTAIEASLDRLIGLVGGETFSGSAVDVAHGGIVRQVDYALVGPVAVYRAHDGSGAGLAMLQHGSLEPSLVELDDQGQIDAASALVASGTGYLPFDASLGSAQKLAQTESGLIDQIEKGGVVMIPILLMAAAALIVALSKLIQLMRVRQPGTKALEVFLLAVKQRDRKKAEAKVLEIAGPIGGMLQRGVEHLSEPKELVEEVMFEEMLETRLKLQSYLSFIALSAAASPLLGLLGTVTGIINTFKLITVFGTGDASTLSGGISEALITTKFGLIVAIPSLLLHGYLSRRSRRFIDQMEKAAVAFLNRIHPSTAPMLPHQGDQSDDNGRDVARTGTMVPAMAGARLATEAVDH